MVASNSKFTMAASRSSTVNVKVILPRPRNSVSQASNIFNHTQFPAEHMPFQLTRGSPGNRYRNESGQASRRYDNEREIRGDSSAVCSKCRHLNFNWFTWRCLVYIIIIVIKHHIFSSSTFFNILISPAINYNCLPM